MRRSPNGKVAWIRASLALVLPIACAVGDDKVDVAASSRAVPDAPLISPAFLRMRIFPAALPRRRVAGSSERAPSGFGAHGRVTGVGGVLVLALISACRCGIHLEGQMRATQALKAAVKTSDDKGLELAASRLSDLTALLGKAERELIAAARVDFGVPD